MNPDGTLTDPATGYRTSPLALLQERIPRGRYYPWRVLVTCALLNMTRGQQAAPVAHEIFRRHPTPGSLLNHIETLSDVLRPLGLQNRRMYLLLQLTADYMTGMPIIDIHGVGEYALDAHNLFVYGMCRTIREPGDAWLLPYWMWRVSGGPRLDWEKYPENG